MEGTRIDKWLWAARFFKTRSLAQTAIERAQVLIGGDRVKLSRAVHPGDEVRIRLGDYERTVRVVALSDKRGSAPIAQQLYEETQQSIARRVEAIAKRALQAEPAHAIQGGRPTKRDRRELERLHDDDDGDEDGG